MNKVVVYAAIACLFLLSSWGVVGHKTIATIAYAHLTPQAKEGVKALLGDTTLADVAAWADEIRQRPAYRHTESWHYVDVPLGLTFKDFEARIDSQQNNVYNALLKNEYKMIYPSTPKAEKADALKFIVHFMGDLHQPMHVSRKEDKGGNTIQLQYQGKGTNLRSLWDGKLIQTEGKDFTQMAVDYDNATPEQIKKWTSVGPMNWLWESYQISSKLYAETPTGSKIDQEYYNAHIGIVHDRIEMAGIRLAAILNEIFRAKKINGTLIPPPPVKSFDR